MPQLKQVFRHKTRWSKPRRVQENLQIYKNYPNWCQLSGYTHPGNIQWNSTTSLARRLCVESLQDNCVIWRHLASQTWWGTNETQTWRYKPHDSCFWIEMKWWHSIGRFKVLLEHFPMETHSALYITAQIYFALDYRHTAWLHALLGSECCTYSHKRLCLHMQLCQQSYSSDLQPWSFHLNYHTHICLNNKHCI